MKKCPFKTIKKYTRFFTDAPGGVINEEISCSRNSAAQESIDFGKCDKKDCAAWNHNWETCGLVFKKVLS